MKVGPIGGLTAQRRFCRRIAPRLMRDAAERQARLLDRAAFELQRGRDRYERERIGEPITDFQVAVVCREAVRRKLDRRDDLVRTQVGVELRRVAGQPMEIGKRNRALARRPGHMHLGLERGEGHAHVGRMRRDAGVARAEDRVHAVEALDGGAAAAGLAFVAGRRGVIEIGAARALQEIAAGRRHVAQLLRRACQDRACEQRIALLDQRVIGEIGIRHERADPQSSVGGLFDGLERQPRNVDQPCRPFDVLFHQVDQIGAARDEFRFWIGGDLAHRVGDVGGPRILEIDHDCPIACWIAATMLGYAPQRQMLPLMSSRISSALFALPRRSGPRPSRSVPACSSRTGTRRGR